MHALWKDFNKGIDNGGSFIAHGLETLEGQLNTGLGADPELIKLIDRLSPSNNEPVKDTIKRLTSSIKEKEEELQRIAALKNQ